MLFCFCSSGKTMLSASGMTFPASSGSATSGSATTGNISNLESSESVLVLTAASVIEPFISQTYKESASEVWYIDMFIFPNDGIWPSVLLIQLCDSYASIL